MGEAEGGGVKTSQRCFFEPPPLRKQRVKGRGKKVRSKQKSRERRERAKQEKKEKRPGTGGREEVNKKKSKRGGPPIPERAVKRVGLVQPFVRGKAVYVC